MLDMRTAICVMTLLLSIAPIPAIFPGKFEISAVAQVVGQTPTPGITRDGVPDPAHGLTITGSPDAPPIMWASLLQTDGKVLIGGEFDHFNGVARKRLCRLNADGTVDGTFNPGIILEGPILAISRQADGKYVVGGSTSTFGQRALWRLNEDGSRDTSFEQTTFNSSTWVNTIAIQSDGKIVIGGGFTSVNGQARSYLARLNADGSIDDLQPVVANGGPTRVNALIVQSDGKIVLGGSFSTINGMSGIRNLAAAHAGRCCRHAILDEPCRGIYGRQEYYRDQWRLVYRLALDCRRWRSGQVWSGEAVRRRRGRSLV